MFGLKSTTGKLKLSCQIFIFKKKKKKNSITHLCLLCLSLYPQVYINYRLGTYLKNNILVHILHQRLKIQCIVKMPLQYFTIIKYEHSIMEDYESKTRKYGIYKAFF